MGIIIWNFCFKFLHHSIKILKSYLNFRVQEEEPVKPAEPAEEGGEQQQQQPNAEKQAENNQNPNQGDEDESGMWEETFKTHTDSKPNGEFSLIFENLNFFKTFTF